MKADWKVNANLNMNTCSDVGSGLHVNTLEC